MAVNGIANLVQNIAGQLFEQTQGRHAGTKTLGTGHEGTEARTEDTFTPSTADTNSTQLTAQDLGIFQESQVALTDVTANILFGQPASNSNQNGATESAALLKTPDAGTVHTTAASSGSPAESVSGPAAAADVQVKLQALNTGLPALGLTYAEIQQIDRIASLIHDFNPAAFTNLVNQFEALTQQSAQQNSAIAPESPGAAAGTDANTNGTALQVKEIFVHLVGAKEAVNNGAASGGGQGLAANNTQIAAAGSQIEQVQFTLANGNGRPVQVQTPQQNTSAATTDQRPSQSRVAVA
jgi:hypothetical protein